MSGAVVTRHIEVQIFGVGVYRFDPAHRLCDMCWMFADEALEAAERGGGRSMWRNEQAGHGIGVVWLHDLSDGNRGA